MEQKTITSLIDLNTRILSPKLSQFWEDSKIETNYVGTLPRCITVKNDCIILRGQNLGEVYDMLSPAHLITWMQGTGYIADWKDRYILIKKDRTVQPLTESQRNHQFISLACFWQQYAALRLCNFPQVRIIPDTDEKLIKLVGDFEMLNKVRKFLNGTMKSESRAGYCEFLGRHSIPKVAIETEPEGESYTDRNSTLTYKPHDQLITQLSQTRVMRDRVQSRILIEHPVDPEGNTGKTQSLAGATFRAMLEKDLQKTPKQMQLFILNESWDIIKGSSKKGQLRLMLPDVILTTQQDSVIVKDDLDDFEEA